MKAKVLRVVVSLLLAANFAGGAWAQGPGFQGPKLFGSWEPKVGAGAAYRIESKGEREPMNWEWAIVGTEKVGTDTGYWMEMSGQERRGEPFVMKQLMVWHQGQADIKRMIVQSGDQPPMEIPITTMMGGRQRGPAQKDVRQSGRRIGTEAITTPAGTFSCEHWQDTSPEGTSDVWLSKDVTPMGVVKSTSPDTTMILTRVITNAQSRIKGQPRSMEEMMRGVQKEE